MDIVPNHCSDQHPWFQAALAAAPGSDERARFWFRDGPTADRRTTGRRCSAVRRGPRSAGDDPQWYLGTFTPYQPDFDHGTPAVDAMFADVLRFWFDRGVDGFRVDAVWPVGKDPALPDAPPLGPGEFNPSTASARGPRRVAALARGARRLHGRASRPRPDDDRRGVRPRPPELMAEYTRPDEFHQCFAFDLLLSPWHAVDAAAIGEAFEHVRPGDWPTFALNNHDAQRIVTRLGTPASTSAGVDRRQPAQRGRRRSTSPSAAAGPGRRRAAAGLPGAVYLYQGEELGLPEVLDLPDDARQDPCSSAPGGRRRVATAAASRCRGRRARPVRSASRWPATAGAPWLPSRPDWGGYAVDQQEGDECRCWRCTAG